MRVLGAERGNSTRRAIFARLRSPGATSSTRNTSVARAMTWTPVVFPFCSKEYPSYSESDSPFPKELEQFCPLSDLLSRNTGHPG